MKSLIEAGLLFGGLRRIDESHLVERYNRALSAMGLDPTGMTSFHIDATGYSPEIAEERGNEHYLDPRGVNRLFVILTPEQRRLPIIQTCFSADLTVYRRFFDANMRAIETLTLHDAVFGEMENLVLEVNEPQDIIGFHTVDFTVHTPSGLLEDALVLETLVKRFNAEPEGWRDTTLHASIVEGARKCGDIRRNGIVPTRLDFEWPDLYHTTHLGGVYVLRLDDGVHLFGDPAKLTPLPENVLTHALSDEEEVLRTLEDADLLEGLNVDWLIGSGILDHRVAMITADILLAAKVPFSPAALLDEMRVSHLIHQHHDVLKRDPRFRVLTQARALAGNDGDLDGYVEKLSAGHHLMLRRAVPDIEDVWEVNRFLAEFTRFDVVTTFIVNKPIFYEWYRLADAAARDFSVEAIAKIYQPAGAQDRDKNQVKSRFFGTH